MAELHDTDKYESGYLPHYLERIAAPRRLLEVGVKNGGSLLLWCDLWGTLEHVIGVDIALPPQVLHPKVIVRQVDQTDTSELDRIGMEWGPFDVVIDDASHLGAASWATFEALWRHVAPGGLYVIEDWGTGYWANWPDGKAYAAAPPPGHVAGMAGMIKRLVDEIDNGNVARIDLLPGIAFAYKDLAGR